MKKTRPQFLFFSLCPLCLCGEPSSSSAADPRPLPRFERVVIDADFPGGYQVEVADVNGDGKPDIVGVGGGTCAWYENPSWKKRIISDDARTPKIISSATADLDGDGKAEVAIAYEFEMNTPATGKLALAIPGAGPNDPWAIRPIDDVPSIHRLRWMPRDGKRPPALVVAPIFGPDARPPAFDQSPARLRLYSLTDGARGADLAGGLRSEVILPDRPGRDAPVLHAIEVLDPRRGPELVRLLSSEGSPCILTADNLGVALVEKAPWKQAPRWGSRPLIPGASGTAPKRGSSEVHLGRLADGRHFLATIDPWHGGEVAVCVSRGDEGNRSGVPLVGGDKLDFGPRTVIDDTLAEGHALWVADVDGDGDDEVFAGHRGKDARVSAYDFDGKAWVRTVLDRAITAQDLRGGDLDGDGTPDLVGIGGASHNVVWYRPIKEKP